MQPAGHSKVQVASVQVFHGKGSFETRSQAAHLQAQYCANIHELITLAYDSYSSIGLSQRYVTLWQKMLPTLAVGFPLTLLTTSEEYSGSLEADMSENHPASFKCEVRNAPSLLLSI